jgi:SAM-dependent methyltransferase
MHESAFDKFRVFVEHYLDGLAPTRLSVLDVGSRAIGQDTGSHRPMITARGWDYCGMDLEPGANVDLVVADGYDWREIADDSHDVVLCSQVLEHTRYPWRLVQEIARVLRPRGLAFLIAPSRGHVHRYPEDCFRYYPDGLPALGHAAGLAVIDAHVQERSVYRSNLWLDASVVLQKPLLDPVEAGRARAGLELARLSMKADMTAAEVAAVDFSPRDAAPSVFADLRTAAPTHAFREQDTALARRARFMWRLEETRQHLSRALKTLTRPI